MWAYLSDAAQKVREDGSEREEAYIENVLAPFIEREGRAAMIQEEQEPWRWE